MKRWFVGVAAGLIIQCLLPVGYGICLAADGMAPAAAAAHSSPATSAAKGPVACVKTVSLGKGTLTEHIVVYGSVIAAPGALQTVSIPFQSQVVSTMVNEGQKVAKGDILLQVKPSPDTLLQLDQAQNTYELAQQSYRQMKRRYDLKLATNEQLLKAKQNLNQAGLRLKSMKDRGIDGTKKIAANVGGLVKKIHVRQGSIVAAGNPLIDIVEQNRIEALLGVEPEDIARVHPGQPVTLNRVNAPAAPRVAGKVRKISYAVNPTTRLVGVFVALTSPAGFLLGESVAGKIAISSAQGLIVPRSAVLPEDGSHVLFTVKDGRAVKHSVAIGAETASRYQVEGKDLKPGMQVVVLGNYELTDGMAVTTGTCR